MVLDSFCLMMMLCGEPLDPIQIIIVGRKKFNIKYYKYKENYNTALQNNSIRYR